MTWDSLKNMRDFIDNIKRVDTMNTMTECPLCGRTVEVYYMRDILTDDHKNRSLSLCDACDSASPWWCDVCGRLLFYRAHAAQARLDEGRRRLFKGRLEKSPYYFGMDLVVCWSCLALYGVDYMLKHKCFPADRERPDFTQTTVQYWDCNSRIIAFPRVSLTRKHVYFIGVDNAIWLMDRAHPRHARRATHQGRTLDRIIKRGSYGMSVYDPLQASPYESEMLALTLRKVNKHRDYLKKINRYSLVERSLYVVDDN